MKYPEKFLLKLPVGTLDRIDGVSENRSSYIRGLIAADLAGPSEIVLDGGKKNSIVPAVQKVGVAKKIPEIIPDRNVDRKAADDVSVLDFLRCGIRTERDAAKALGWGSMRVSKSVARLGAAGRVKFSGGAIEVL